MKKNLTYIGPVRAGMVSAAFHGIISLIMVPFLLLFGVFGGLAGGPLAAAFGVGMAIAVPLIYAALGFITGMVMAAVYNLTVKWTGGFEFEVREGGLTV